jgi:cystathionine beta-lyase
MVGVAELLRTLTPEGAGVVINPPVYPPFFSIIAETGRRAVEVPLEDGQLPLDGMRDALRDGARAVLLCNPQNPTGSVWSAEDVHAVGDIAAEHDALFLSDEIHAPLTMPGVTHTPATDAIVLTSATKAWNLAGLKCGLAIGPPEVLAQLPEPIHDRVGHLGILASAVAFAEGGDWLDELRDYLAATRRSLPDLLAEHAPGVRVNPAQATFLAWLDFRETPIADDPAAAVLERGRLAAAGAGLRLRGEGLRPSQHRDISRARRRVGQEDRPRAEPSS